MVNVNHECLIFYIFRLRTVTERTSKILKMDWRTPGLFYFQKSGNPVIANCHTAAFISLLFVEHCHESECCSRNTCANRSQSGKRLS